MGKCKFEEAIKEMKTFIQERVKGKFVSADTKGVLQVKLDEIAKMELMVRKLQGTVRVTNVSKVVVSKPAVAKKAEISKPTVVVKTSNKLKIMNGTITDKDGKASILVNSMEELRGLSEEFNKLMKELGKGPETTTDKIYQDGFEMLEKAGIEFRPFKLTFKKELSSGGYGVHNTKSGNIDVATGVTYNRNPQGILLHEYAHRISSEKLDKFPVLKEKIEKLMEHAKKNGVTGYGMTDRYEFIAETISNPKFQERLSKVPSYEGKGIVETVKKVFSKLLERVTGKEASALADGLDLIVRLAKAEVDEIKVDTKQEKGKIDVTDPIATMKAMQEMKLEKEENTKMFMKTVVDVAADQKAFMQDIHDKRVKAVNESLDDIIKKTIKPTIVESSINTLLNYTLDRPVMTMGMYDTTSNRVVLSTLVKEEADNKAREAAVEKYIDLVYGSVDDEQYAVLVNKLKNDKEFMDLIEPSVREVAADIWAKYIKEKGNHAVSHELVHAGAVRYMKNNPDSDLAKRVNELYEAALEHVPRRGDSYWATNVDEFLAEALTNPVTIREMNSVIVEGKTRGLIILKELLDTVLDMLGFKKDSTIYQEVLQSYAGILEQVIGTEAEASLKDIADIAVKELKAKQLLLEGMKDC